MKNVYLPVKNNYTLLENSDPDSDPQIIADIGIQFLKFTIS